MKKVWVVACVPNGNAFVERKTEAEFDKAVLAEMKLPQSERKRLYSYHTRALAYEKAVEHVTEGLTFFDGALRRLLKERDE